MKTTLLRLILNLIIKPFKELIKEVRTEWENKFKLNTPLLNDAIIKYPWLPEAISKLDSKRWQA